MSALGEKRTFREVETMSALPPKADIRTQPRNVRFVPKADIELAFVLCYPCAALTATDRLAHTGAAAARAIILCSAQEVWRSPYLLMPCFLQVVDRAAYIFDISETHHCGQGPSSASGKSITQGGF
jgi:hypothetical protein